jgi:CubicO group peptidase (beta-lactamase class C family)
MRRACVAGLTLTLLLGLAGCAGSTTEAEAGADDESTGTSDAGSESDGETETGSETESGSETETGEGETGDGDGDEPIVYPEPDWVPEPPEQHGLDPAALEAAAALAEEAGSGCLLVTRHGVIVGEWYWDGWAQGTQTPVFSVTKSITSALVGIAADDELLAIDDWASDYVDEWTGTESEALTIRNLLSNDSGRYWEFVSDYVTLTASSNKTQFSIELDQQHLPGEWWDYNNSAIQTHERVLSTSTGEDVGDYARNRLFDPIGMKSSFAHDPGGNAVMYADVMASCRDLARFGYLFLRGGQWAEGVQVISADWVSESTSPSTAHNDAYGYLWWLNNEGHWIRPSAPLREEGDGPLLPDAPLGAYSARGLGSQIVGVDPATEIVFTRLAEVPLDQLISGGPEIEGPLWGAIMGAVIE